MLLRNMIEVGRAEKHIMCRFLFLAKEVPSSQELYSLEVDLVKQWPWAL